MGPGETVILILMMMMMMIVMLMMVIMVMVIMVMVMEEAHLHLLLLEPAHNHRKNRDICEVSLVVTVSQYQNIKMTKKNELFTCMISTLHPCFCLTSFSRACSFSMLRPTCGTSNLIFVKGYF